MTRRARGKGRVLGLDAYIHRATLGLPRDERLDAAAELRTHLLERVAEHGAQGFSREEAEYLAVKGMGEPQSVSRGLLGHVFTHRLGWTALAALVLAGGGWYVYREWLPPRVGVTQMNFTADDAKLLFTQPQAPRGNYLSFLITYPKHTQSVVVALISQDLREIQVMSRNPQKLTGTDGQRIVSPGPPGSYRLQQKMLVLPAVVSSTPGNPWYGCDGSSLYFNVSEFASTFNRYADSGMGTAGGFVPYGACSDWQKKLATQLPLQAQPKWWERPMALNQWNLVFSYGAGWGTKDTTQVPPKSTYQERDLYLAILPTERNLTPQYPFFAAHEGRIRIDGDTQDLPPLPALP